MTALIHPDGAPDASAIDAEINRRCAAQTERVGWANRHYHEQHVLQDVAAAQWPLIEAEIADEWSPGERRVYEEALAAARAVPDSAPKRYEDLSYRARSIRDTVIARAVERFHKRIGS